MAVRRERVEEALSEDQLRALGATCQSIGIPFENWPRLPWLRRATVYAAAYRLIRGYEADGKTLDLAISLAAAKVGLKYGALKTHVYRDMRARAEKVSERNTDGKAAA